MKNSEISAAAMKRALVWADSEEEAQRSRGFDVIAELAAELPQNAPGELGFFDDSLFYARKYASDPRESVARSVVAALLAIGERSASWREAVIETVDEIGMQPSEAPKRVAEQARRQLKRA